MKSTQSFNNYLNRILQDQSLHRQWENLYNTSSGNLNSGSYSEFLASKGSSQNDLSRFLKNARFSFDLQESVEIGGHKHSPDVSFYKQKVQDVIQINFLYRQKTTEIKDILTQAISLIQDKLPKLMKDFQFFSGYLEDNPLQQTLNMAVFIRKTFQKFQQPKNGVEISQLKQKIAKLRSENNVLQKNNEKLLNYIEQRKNYSEGLKFKISKLKDQVKEVAKRQQLFRGILEGLDHFQEDLDLKYRNRTDLISMIKSLLARIIKHNKQCKGSSDAQPLLSFDFLDKFTIKTSQSAKTKELETLRQKGAQRK